MYEVALSKLLNVLTRQRFETLCLFTVTLLYALLLWTRSLAAHPNSRPHRTPEIKPGAFLSFGPEDAAELWSAHSAHVSTWRALRTELSQKQPATRSHLTV